MTQHRPVLPAAQLTAFQQWLQERDGRSKYAALTFRVAMERLLSRPRGEPITDTEVRSRATWLTFCQHYGFDPWTTNEQLRPWWARLTEVVLTLLDSMNPSLEQRILRLIARTESQPHCVLEQTPQGLLTAIEEGELSVYPLHAKTRRIISLDPGLREEIVGVLFVLLPKTVARQAENLASHLTGSSRADGNGAAQTRLRRAWTAFCQERGLEGVTLTDLATVLQQERQT